MDDDNYVAEVRGRGGQGRQDRRSVWKKGSGNTSWDDSVRKAIADVVQSIDRPPPTNFPAQVTIRFDVQEETEPVLAMSLKKTSRRGHGTMNELNITPLLDLVFVLLVIFIITTPQMMNNLEMTLPSGKPPPPKKEKPKINRIDVAANGKSRSTNRL